MLSNSEKLQKPFWSTWELRIYCTYNFNLSNKPSGAAVVVEIVAVDGGVGAPVVVFVGAPVVVLWKAMKESVECLWWKRT